MAGEVWADSLVLGSALDDIVALRDCMAELGLKVEFLVRYEMRHAQFSFVYRGGILLKSWCSFQRRLRQGGLA
jgi:hypothetical protein